MTIIQSYMNDYYDVVVGMEASPDDGLAISKFEVNTRLWAMREEAIRKAAAGMGPRRVRMQVRNSELDRLRAACGHDITIEGPPNPAPRSFIGYSVKLPPPAWRS
jgi:hypothetical protein